MHAHPNAAPANRTRARAKRATYHPHFGWSGWCVKEARRRRLRLEKFARRELKTFVRRERRRYKKAQEVLHA